MNKTGSVGFDPMLSWFTAQNINRWATVKTRKVQLNWWKGQVTFKPQELQGTDAYDTFYIILLITEWYRF